MDFKCKIATNVEELEIISRCRMAAFPESLSSKLGSEYVVKMLNYYIKDRNFLIYLEADNRCLGYITAMVSEDGFLCSTRELIDLTYKDLIKSFLRKPYLIFQPIVLSNYKIAIEIIGRKLLNKKQKVTTQLEEDPALLNSVGLIDIAVAPDFQGKGFSTILLQKFEKQCYKIGMTRMHLSVKPENNAAIKSYSKSGWKILKEEPKQIVFIKNN